MNTPFLSVQGLAKDFNGQPIFENINAEFSSGSFVALLGPSGCGKSTLLRLIADLIPPSTGHIHYANPQELRRSFVFQDPTLLPWLNVTENVLLPIELKDSSLLPAFTPRALRELARLRLKDFAHHYPAELSGGMKMRVSLARALLTDPKLLLLDEPFAALDEETREDLDHDLRALFEQNCLDPHNQMNVFFVTHSVSEAAFLADRILIFSGTMPSHIVFDIESPLKALTRNQSLRSDQRYYAFCADLSAKLRIPL